jgi:large subunit ribosomal protein L10
MPNIKNQQQLDKLKAAIKNSKAVVLANYSGLSVNDQNQLRSAIEEAGGSFSVTKNTLMSLALQDLLGELPADLINALQGPNATLFMIEDPVAPTKALVQFSNDHEEKPEIKIGIMDGEMLSTVQIKNLAKLPGREELLGMLVGQLNAPISGFAQVLRANLQNLVYALNAIKAQRV